MKRNKVVFVHLFIIQKRTEDGWQKDVEGLLHVHVCHDMIHDDDDYDYEGNQCRQAVS